MAESKKISELIAATAIENADTIPIQQGAVTKKLPFQKLKESQEGYFQKEGTVIWDSETGEINISTLTFTDAYVYEIWISGGAFNVNSLIKICFRYNEPAPNESYLLAVLLNESGVYAGGKISILDNFLSLEITELNGAPLAYTWFKIYKVNKLGILNLNEVT